MGRVRRPPKKLTETFLTLLKASLYGTPLTDADLPEGIDWEAVYGLARSQGVLGFIADAVELLPEEMAPPAAMRQKLFKTAYGMFAAYNRACQVLAEVTGELNDAGIPSVLMKGISGAQYYRKPELRRFGDIDIYVGAERFADACRLLMSEGETFDEARLLGHHHWETERGDILIEVHRYAARLFRRRRNRVFQQFIAREVADPSRLPSVKVGEVEVKRPTLTFDALYLFVHAWRHFSGYKGISVRHLTDWLMVFRNHADGIDRSLLEETIRRCGLVRPWRVFAWIAVNKFDVPAAGMPLYDPSVRKLGERAFGEIISPPLYIPIADSDRKHLHGKLLISLNHLRSALRNLRYSPGDVIGYTLNDIFYIFPHKLTN